MHMLHFTLQLGLCQAACQPGRQLTEMLLAGQVGADMSCVRATLMAAVQSVPL
jgi:hypothetical protein